MSEALGMALYAGCFVAVFLMPICAVLVVSELIYRRFIERDGGPE